MSSSDGGRAQDGEPVPAAKEDGTTRSLALFRCSPVLIVYHVRWWTLELTVLVWGSGVAEAQGLADFLLQEVASADEDDIPLLRAPCPFLRASLQPLQPQASLLPASSIPLCATACNDLADPCVYCLRAGTERAQ